MSRNSNDLNMRGQPFASASEQELDRMLGMLVPPEPSDTLRARLKRDFALAAPEPAPSRAAWRPWRAFDGRVGGMAVAAALVLAVALGTLVPATPAPEGPAVAAMPADGAASFYAYDEVAADDDMLSEALADSAPDSAAFMVATFDAATRDTYTGGSGGLLTNASYDTGGFAGMMPLE